MTTKPDTFLDKFFMKSLQADGSDLPDQPILNVIGGTLADDPANERTTLTLGGGGYTIQVAGSGEFGASKNDAWLCLMSGDTTIDTPRSPSPGDRFLVKVYGALGGHTLTVSTSGDGNTVESPSSPGTYASTATVTTEGQAVVFVYDGSNANQWFIESNTVPAAATPMTSFVLPILQGNLSAPWTTTSTSAAEVAYIARQLFDATKFPASIGGQSLHLKLEVIGKVSGTGSPTSWHVDLFDEFSSSTITGSAFSPGSTSTNQYVHAFSTSELTQGSASGDFPGSGGLIALRAWCNSSGQTVTILAANIYGFYA